MSVYGSHRRSEIETGHYSEWGRGKEGTGGGVGRTTQQQSISVYSEYIHYKVLFRDRISDFFGHNQMEMLLKQFCTLLQIRSTTLCKLVCQVLPILLVVTDPLPSLPHAILLPLLNGLQIMMSLHTVKQTGRIQLSLLNKYKQRRQNFVSSGVIDESLLCSLNIVVKGNQNQRK